MSFVKFEVYCWQGEIVTSDDCQIKQFGREID